MSKKEFSRWMAGTALLICAAPYAQANTFSSNATVTFTIDSIVNTSGVAEDWQGLQIGGRYALDQSLSYLNDAEAVNGAFTPIDASGDYSASIGPGSFTKTMAISGSTSSGSADAYYLGLFDLTFLNSSAHSFDIQVTLSYDLSTSVSGDYSESAIQLDYFNATGGFDSGANGLSVYAATPYFSADGLSGAVVYNFSLNPGDSEAVYVDVGTSAYIETAPVPLPGAWYLFATAIALPMWQRVKPRIA
ncbi:hypothetical protein [Methylomonas sp. HYX-M1]|uniref:hypothetical protein n=1 Tax=Methylomonas sp. HYX-M1 TaxID=3139307 RepID=UPI00345C5B17